MFRKRVSILLTVLFLSACTTVPTSESLGTERPKARPAPIVAPSVRATELDSGNKNMGRVTVGAGESERVEIEDHSYQVISSEEALTKMQKVTTYVLLPKNFSTETETDSAAYLRYERVLKLIQHLDKVEVERNGEVSDFYENENIFVLFSDAQNIPITVKSYNYALSNKVLKFFRKSYGNSLFREDGPYLITTIKNVWNHPEDFSFLYVNLTNFNKSAVDEIIGAYQERLIERGIDEITTFETWHAGLLSFVTNFGSDIKIFQTAVAGGLN